MSGSVTVQHNDDGTKQINISASSTLPNGSGWGPKSGSASGDVWLDTIARASYPSLNTSNFNIEDNVTIYTNRRSGTFTHHLYYSFNGSGEIGIASGITDSYTWNTAGLYQLITNGNTGNGYFRLYTFSGNTNIGNNTVSFVAKVTNSNPIFESFEWEDVNEKTLALTGDNHTIIANYSNIKGKVSVSNKAIAQNYATMSKYRLLVGDKQIDFNYSASEDVEKVLNNVNSNIVNMYAIDSRGNSTNKGLSANNYVNYTDIVIKSASIIRSEGGVGTQATLNFSGEIWNGNFGNVNNSIINCKYTYKKTSDTEWTAEPISIIPTKSENSISFNGLIEGDLGATGFNNEYSYNVKLEIEDELSKYTYDILLGVGKPLIAIGGSGLSIGQPYIGSIGGLVQINGMTLEDYIKSIK